ncbi:MAG: hypothetical protein ACRAVC_09960 [Trichormus sp.]
MGREGSVGGKICSPPSHTKHTKHTKHTPALTRFQLNKRAIPPCPMPDARCPMPNAPCPMPHAQNSLILNFEF